MTVKRQSVRPAFFGRFAAGLLAAVSLAAALLAAALLVGCGSHQLADEVRQALDSGNGRIADLRDGDAELVDLGAVLAASERADVVGTRLRVVIVDAESDLIDARSLTDAFGGTALSYRANGSQFEAASADASIDQLAEAMTVAAERSTVHASVGAFVDVLQTQGLEPPKRNVWISVVLAVCALSVVFVIWQVLRFVKARRERSDRVAAFVTRREALSARGGALVPELKSMANAARRSNATQTSWNGLATFAKSVPKTLAEARTTADLDAMEMRIDRAFAQARDLRRALGV